MERIKYFWCRLRLACGLGTSYSIWEYGTAGNTARHSRRHKIKGNVQFILWEAGEQDYQDDYWHDFDPYWWNTFRRY